MSIVSILSPHFFLWLSERSLQHMFLLFWPPFFAINKYVNLMLKSMLTLNTTIRLWHHYIGLFLSRYWLKASYGGAILYICWAIVTVFVYIWISVGMQVGIIWN